MSDTDHDDSLREAFAARAEGPYMAGAACPEPERLWDAAQEDLSATETRTLIEHTADCAPCAEAWRLATAVGAAASRRATARRIGLAWKSLAAAAVAAALAAPLWIGSRDEPEDALRASSAVEIVTLVPEDAALPRDACLLRWDVDGGKAVRFHVVVSTPDLDLLFEAHGLADPQLLVPAESLARVAAGAEIVWQVDAVLAAGGSVRSRAFVHTVE